MLWQWLRVRERNDTECSTRATASVSLSETNEWENVINSPAVLAFFDIILPLVFACELVFATYKLVSFMRIQGCATSVPVVFLSMEVVACMLRIGFLAVDPFGKRGIFSYGATSILISITWPINVINTLLIALFYRELNAGPMRMGLFLDEMQIPYVVVRALERAL